MAQEQPKEYNITETFVVIYTINGLVRNPEPTLTISEKLWKILDPTSSLCVMGAAEITEHLYQYGSEKYGVDVKLRNWILPPDRIALGLLKLKNGLRTVAYYTPKPIRGLFPIDLVCQDVAMFASRAGSVLKLTQKMQACITRTGEIAKDTLVKESAKEAQKLLQSSMKSTVQMVVPLSAPAIAPQALTEAPAQKPAAVIAKAPAPVVQQPAAAPLSALPPLAQQPSAKPVAEKTERGWGSALWSAAKSAAKSELGQSMIKQATGAITDKVPALKPLQDAVAQAPASSSFADTVKKVVANEQVQKAASSAVTAYQEGGATAVVSKAGEIAMSHLPSREVVVDFAVAKASAKMTKPVIEAANAKIDSSVKKMNDDLAAKEKEYLTQVSSVVVDNAAKQVLTFCMSSGLCIATAAYVVPSVTKWGLSFFMGDATVEALTTTVTYVAIAMTGVAVVKTTGTYRAEREANQKKFAPLNKVEADVKEGAMTAVTQQAAKWLPESGDEQSIVGQFTERCQKELPEVFLATGNGPRK